MTASWGGRGGEGGSVFSPYHSTPTPNQMKKKELYAYRANNESSTHSFSVANLKKEYHMLSKDTIWDCIMFRRSLLATPSLSSSHGRLALLNLCNIIHRMLPEPYYDRVYTINVGDNTPVWPGNCNIGYTYGSQDLTGEDLVERLQKCDCKKDLQMQSPDIQVN